MNDQQLTRLRADLLRLYEEYHPALTPAEEQAITTIRDFILEELS